MAQHLITEFVIHFIEFKILIFVLLSMYNYFEEFCLYYFQNTGFILVGKIAFAIALACSLFEFTVNLVYITLEYTSVHIGHIIYFIQKIIGIWSL